VQVHRDEGVANHIGPKPCARVREDVGEASAGERTGQPSSRETVLISSADDVHLSEGNTAGRATASARSDSAWSKTLACAEVPCAGTGRSLDRPSAFGSHGPWREGEEP
jgi:hypothetical protein